MTPQERHALLRLMHQTYCAEVNRFQPYTVRETLRWEHLLYVIEPYGVAGDEAVRLVARRLLKLDAEARKRGFDGWKHKLAFIRFVDEAFFTEHLSAALAERRKPKPQPGYTEVMRATGRSVEPPASTARKADEIIASKGFKDLLKLRDELT